MAGSFHRASRVPFHVVYMVHNSGLPREYILETCVHRGFNLRLTCCCIIAFVAALTAHAQNASTLTIFAASSLTDAFEQLSAGFLESNTEADIVLNFASSTKLAAQLLAGAQADIFASANEAQLDKVVEDGRIHADQVKHFAMNQLVLTLPADNPGDIESLEDLATKPVLLVLAVTGTPIREYTDAMIQSHNEDFGDDFAERVMQNLVSEESNVRLVVARVALGEADAGIVYQTDVIGAVSDKLMTIAIDPRHNQLASYPIATLADSRQTEIADRFIEYVLSHEGQAILRDYGFCSPTEDADVADEVATLEPTQEAIVIEELESNPCERPNAES